MDKSSNLKQEANEAKASTSELLSKNLETVESINHELREELDRLHSQVEELKTQQGNIKNALTNIDQNNRTSQLVLESSLESDKSRIRTLVDEQIRDLETGVLAYDFFEGFSEVALPSALMSFFELGLCIASSHYFPFTCRGRLHLVRVRMPGPSY